jgi:hypothetical protein
MVVTSRVGHKREPLKYVLCPDTALRRFLQCSLTARVNCASRKHRAFSIHNSLFLLARQSDGTRP